MMHGFSYLEPKNMFRDENINEELWEKAQNRFDELYGHDINVQIGYHVSMASRLKEKKWEKVYAIYSSMKEEVT